MVNSHQRCGSYGHFCNATKISQNIFNFENTCTKFAVAPKPYVLGTKFDTFWIQDIQFYIFLKDCNIQLLVI